MIPSRAWNATTRSGDRNSAGYFAFAIGGNRKSKRIALAGTNIITSKINDRSKPRETCNCSSAVLCLSLFAIMLISRLLKTSRNSSLATRVSAHGCASSKSIEWTVRGGRRLPEREYTKKEKFVLSSPSRELLENYYEKRPRELRGLFAFQRMFLRTNEILVPEEGVEPTRGVIPGRF